MTTKLSIYFLNYVIKYFYNISFFSPRTWRFILLQPILLRRRWRSQILLLRRSVDFPRFAPLQARSESKKLSRGVGDRPPRRRAGLRRKGLHVQMSPSSNSTKPSPPAPESARTTSQLLSAAGGISVSPVDDLPEIKPARKSDKSAAKRKRKNKAGGDGQQRKRNKHKCRPVR